MLTISRGARAEAEDLPRRVAHRLDELRAEHPEAPPAAFRQSVRDVVVVASSSRGGSSMFAEILRASAGLLHFRAEVNPFFRLAGLVRPANGRDSDELRPEDLTPARAVDGVERELSLDCGQPARDLSSPEDVDRFASDLAVRLTLQWPEEAFPRRDVRAWLGDALGALVAERGWRAGRFEDAQEFHATFLARVREDRPRVSPWHYDLSAALIRERSGAADVPAGPPSAAVVEEPPFVCIGPWRRPSGEDLLRKPLVVKTPSNSYRLEALRALFPAARFRLIHLTRNPAASINGLYDGWLHRGFHSHRLETPLSIRGYSDRFPDWARSWWKFDLPPGWRAWRGSFLEEVCAFQWRAAHEAILEFRRRHPEVPCRVVRFEDAIGGIEARRAAFDGLFRWLGVEQGDGVRELVEHGLPPIMATDRPRHRRWFDRAALLGPALRDERTRSVTERLGYDDDPDSWI